MKRSHQIALVGVPALVGSSLANAALDTAVTDSITAAQADIVQAGGLIIGIAAVVMGLRWVKAMFF